jgi:hypothetical protein
MKRAVNVKCYAIILAVSGNPGQGSPMNEWSRIPGEILIMIEKGLEKVENW